MFVECVNTRIALFGKYIHLLKEACLSCNKREHHQKKLSSIFRRKSRNLILQNGRRVLDDFESIHHYGLYAVCFWEHMPAEISYVYRP